MCKDARAITLRFDPPTPVGITAWVGISNNAGQPATGCTLRDGVTYPRPFDVTGGLTLTRQQQF